METKWFWVTRAAKSNYYKIWTVKPNNEWGIGWSHSTQGSSDMFCEDIFKALTGLSFRGGPKGIRKVRLLVAK